jgi:hypothetical protein
MTDKEINEEARNALKNAGNPGGLSSVIYKDTKQIKLFDNSGFYIYEFNLAKGTVKYRSKEEHPMDDKTKKAAQRYIIKDMSPLLILCAFAVAFMVFVAISSSKASKLQKSGSTQTEQAVKANEDLKSTLVVDSVQKVR